MSTRAAHRHGKLVLISLALAVSALPSCLRSEDWLADRPDASQRRVAFARNENGPGAQPVVETPAGPEGAASH